MNINKYPLIKTITFFICLLFSLKSNKTNAQELNEDLCKEFLSSNELYLINSSVNTKKFTIANGYSFTLEQLVHESWPDKKITLINEQEYNKLKDVKTKFHLMVTRLVMSKNGSERGAIDALQLQKGKTGLSYKFIYWYQINLEEILKGIAPERLIYAVENTKNLVANYNDKSFRDKYFYKSVDYKNHLKSDTLYLREIDFIKQWKPEKVKECYMNPYKIVTQEQWLKAISEKREHVLFTDFVRGGYYTAINVYKAKDGKLITGSYPWIGYNYPVNKTIFKKLLN